MLQRGICNVHELIREVGSLRGSVTRLRRPCYVGLYDEVLASSSPNIDLLLEAILQGFCTSNGVFKRTNGARFDHFDQQIISCMDSIPLIRNRYLIHDLAVSDGRTACDFFFALSSVLGDRLDFYATDSCLKVCVLQREGARTRLVTDEYGNMLQIMFPPFVLSNKRSRRQMLLYPANRALQRFLSRTAVKEIQRLATSGDSSIQRQEVLLICPQARTALEKHHNFHIEVHDVFNTTSRRYSVVRAMNIFNPTYFSEAEIVNALRRVHESLEEEGILITGSNEDSGSTVDGGVYRKKEDGFLLAFRSGAGSPIDHLLRSGLHA
jgi:hypothetical protein